jgi:hypothetical protein
MVALANARASFVIVSKCSRNINMVLVMSYYLSLYDIKKIVVQLSQMGFYKKKFMYANKTIDNLKFSRQRIVIP